MYAAALTALAPDIKDKRAEIVLFQHRKDSADGAIEERAEDGENERNDEAKERNLKKAWNNMQAEFDKRVKEDMFPDDPETSSKRVARELKSALKGAYSDSGQWAWLRFPPSNPLYTDPRTLWLTWTPDKTYEPQGQWH